MGANGPNGSVSVNCGLISKKTGLQHIALKADQIAARNEKMRGNCYMIAKCYHLRFWPGCQGGEATLCNSTPSLHRSCGKRSKNIVMFTFLEKKDNNKIGLWERSWEVHHVPAAINGASPTIKLSVNLNASEWSRELFILSWQHYN